jgi:hypothetical protein
MTLRFVWSALVLGAALLYGGLAQATDPPPACAPAARLEGDHGLLAPIRASLQARGVAEGGALDCQRLEVRVMPASPGYDLFLTDADGRTDRRQIARAETAAMVIESWLQADLSDPLLDRGAPALVVEHAPPVRHGMPALGSLRGESAVDRGSAMWWGAAAGACFRLGPLCAGPQARLRASTGPPASGARSLQDLRSFEGGLGLEAPVALGPFRLLPGIFLGAGRLSGRWSEPTVEATAGERGRDRGPDRNPYRTAGRNDGERGGRDQDSNPISATEPFARVGLRAGAGLGLALPLGAGVAVELQLAVGVRPVAPDGGSRGRGLVTTDLVGHAGAGLGLRYGSL